MPPLHQASEGNEELCRAPAQDQAKMFLFGFGLLRGFTSGQKMTDSQTLLLEYARNGSESAFRELVSRYTNLVYSTALRLVGGDAHLAEDVAQTVFIGLASRARTLSTELMLGGWLHQHTYHVATKTMRGERRRKSREREAVEMNTLQDGSGADWRQVAPILDEAITQLGSEDRTAILLRFFEQRDFGSVGKALGSNEDAARMRVNRASEKLHSLLKHRGVTLSSAALGTALATEAVAAAPAGVAASIAAAALASAAASGGLTTTFVQTMALTKVKFGIVSAIILASVVTPLMLHQRAQARLRSQQEAMRQQADQLATLQPENDRLSNRLAQTGTPGALPEAQARELLKLRGEVGRLRADVRSFTKIAAFREEIAQLPLEKVWPARVNRLKQWLKEHPSEKIPELYLLPERSWLNSIYPIPVENDEECRRAMSIVRANAKGRTFTALADALHQYAEGNGGQFPTDLSQLKPFLDPPLDDEVLGRYTILPASRLVSELRQGGDWVITEKAPVNEAADSREAIGLNSSRLVTSEVTNRWTLLQ
jgi:RNA polymerase sigma factor (sigma-70 family)